MLGTCAGQVRMRSANSRIVNSQRIAQVHRIALVGLHQPIQAIHQIAT